MKIFAVADHIISPLGSGTAINFEAMKSGRSGVKSIDDQNLFHQPFMGARIEDGLLPESYPPQGAQEYTRLEKFIIHSIQSVLEQCAGLDFSKLLWVLSTTKGNIELLDKPCHGIDNNRQELYQLAKVVNAYFKFEHAPVVVSNACISGISALITGKKIIETGQFDHVIVTGADSLSKFVVSGFDCLKALSPEICQPYDAARKGINLGEACGTVLLSKDPAVANCLEPVIVSGFGQSNDANHISGPSRTGEGLKMAIRKALKHSDISATQVNYICAHGTATLYNDDMESLAFQDCKLSHVPLNSLKAYFGHTLGAAGIIESIITFQEMKSGILLQSLGYQHPGTSAPLSVLKQHETIADLQYALKTCSGFGGCNAAILFEKAWN